MCWAQWLAYVKPSNYGAVGWEAARCSGWQGTGLSGKFKQVEESPAKLRSFLISLKALFRNKNHLGSVSEDRNKT